jgi:hypothetical protein
MQGLLTYSSVADPGCLSWISDPNFFHTRSRIQGQKDSRIPDPHQHQRIKVFKPKKLFFSSWKYDPECSFRILDPVVDFLPIRGLKGTGSRIPDPQHWVILLLFLP